MNEHPLVSLPQTRAFQKDVLLVVAVLFHCLLLNYYHCQPFVVLCHYLETALFLGRTFDTLCVQTTFFVSVKLSCCASEQT